MSTTDHLERWRIYAWQARRSGATMTIEGSARSGERLIVTNVARIYADQDGNILATTTAGEAWILKPAPRTEAMAA